MTNDINHKEDFAEYMKQLEELQELAKGDVRSDKRDKKDKKLRELAYESLMEYKDELKAEGIDITNVINSPEDLKNQPKIYETGLKKMQENANERSANILVKNLDEILKDLPKDSLEELAFQKPLVENADEKLVEKYKDILGLYQNYFKVKELMEKYKNGEKLDPEKEEPVLYSAIAVAAAERIKKRLKKEGLSERMQEIGASIAFLTAQNKGIERKAVLENADKMVRESEEKLRKYESEKDKKIVDYVAKSLDKLVKDENPEKFNIGRNLVYDVVKESKNDREDNIIEYPINLRRAA